MSETIHEGPEEELKQDEQAAKAADAEVTEKPDISEVPAKVTEKPEVPQVPIHALHEARAEIAKLKEQNTKFEGLYDDVQAWRQSQKAGQENEAFNADPLGSLRDDIKALRNDQAQRNTASDQQAQSQLEVTQLRSAVEQQVATFTKDNPDYQAALDHVMASRSQELTLMGTPPGQIQAVLDQESISLAHNAMQGGRNPAEDIYNLAKLRGYVPGTKPQIDVKAQMAAIEKGQENAQQLPAGAENQVGLLDIESMTDKEFDEYWDKNISQGNAL